MKMIRFATVTFASIVLLVTSLAATPPAVLHSATGSRSPHVPLDTATATASLTATPTVIPSATPSDCAGWSAQAPYPIAISNNAVASLGGYIYSFGGATISNTMAAAAYKFDGNIWTAIASLPISLTRTTAVSDGTYIYILSEGYSIYNAAPLYRYDPVSDTYTALPGPLNGAYAQNLVYLNGSIYRLGVSSRSQYIHIMDRFIISMGQWRSETNFPVSGPFPITAVALDGFIYAAGSEESPNTYRYDTTTNLWDDAAVADLQFYPNGATSGVLNGEWLLISGYPSPHPTYIWNPATNLWRRTADDPSLLYSTTGASWGNAFYTVGGGDSSGQPASDVERYTNTCPSPTPTPTVTGTPPTATPSPTPPCQAWQGQPAYPYFAAFNTITSLNGDLYSFGGSDGYQLIPHSYKYDGTYWAQIADPPATFEFASAVTDGRYIYILNGDGPVGPTNNLYRYDPTADSYITLTNTPISTTEQAAAYLNGKIYLIGGQTVSSTYTSPVQVYDISANSWSRAASYPQPILFAPAVSLNGYIYVGDNNGGYGYYPSKTYRYDPTANLWSDSAIADAPILLAGAATGIFNGQWLLAGGVDNYYGAAISWNPTSNTWFPLTPMATPHGWTSGATLGNAFYAVGGSAHILNYAINNDNQRYTNTCAPAPPPPTPTLCATPFGDISGDAFYGAIAYLYCRGAVSGTDATHYSPAATSTRGQFARVVVKGFGLPIVTSSGGGQSFTDVPPAYFAYNYIETGLAAGFLSGYTAAQCDAAVAAYPCYLPNRPITRAELTKLVVKAAGYSPSTPSGGPTFVDVPASYFAYGYIETAYQHGIIRGIDATHFQPDRIIRRDEMAQIVYKGYVTP